MFQDFMVLELFRCRIRPVRGQGLCKTPSPPRRLSWLRAVAGNVLHGLTHGVEFVHDHLLRPDFRGCAGVQQHCLGPRYWVPGNTASYGRSSDAQMSMRLRIRRRSVAQHQLPERLHIRGQGTVSAVQSVERRPRSEYASSLILITFPRLSCFSNEYPYFRAPMVNVEAEDDYAHQNLETST
jgi:hypothetical protein